ncbi:MAG: M42 family metallopeptidase [Cellulosilyticaceae bacterium]
MDTQKIYTYLEKYLSIPSPGGYTKTAISACKQDFERMGIETSYTKKGGLIATMIGEDSSKQVVISAHMDTLGGMVKEILPNGRIRYHRIGGGVYNSVEGENCILMTGEGKQFQGSVMPLKASTHIYGQEGASESRNEHTMVIRLDEPINGKQDVLDLGINVGDFIAMEPRFVVTENGFIKSRYLDNKACIAVILELCERWQTMKIIPAYTTQFYISNFEEMGHGVSNVFEENVFELIALDIGIVGEGQQSKEFGVSIAAKDAKTVYDYSLRQKLEQLCKKNEITYATDVYNRYSSDASQAVQFGCDFKFACIGPGVDASHHYERTNVQALIATSKLLEAYLMSE